MDLFHGANRAVASHPKRLFAAWVPPIPGEKACSLRLVCVRVFEGHSSVCFPPEADTSQSDSYWPLPDCPLVAAFDPLQTLALLLVRWDL